MSVLYRHSQRGTAILTGLAMIAPVIVIVVALLLRQQEVGPIAAIAFVVLALLAGTAWYFSSMTIEVTQDELRWHFGPGGYYRIVLSDIESVAPAHHSLLWGYGIRWMGPKRWAYIVAGRDAVDLRLRGGGLRRLGSDDRDRLVAALRSAKNEP